VAQGIKTSLLGKPLIQLGLYRDQDGSHLTQVVKEVPFDNVRRKFWVIC
jgi:hypothetical protein